VSDSQLPLIRNEYDPRRIWEILKNAHEGVGWANRIALQRKLLTTKKDETTSMQSHVNEIGEIADRLTNLGITINEDTRIIAILASLPKSFENVLTAIESVLDGMAPTSTPAENLEYVIKRLINEETCRTELEGQPKPNSNDIALITKNKRLVDKSQITCWNCGKTGHYRHECPTDEKKERASVAFMNPTAT
jgi:hypothetical protein